ncbi:hypothetical protein [Deinococcus deserti]|nr:hypothetical protein [Deinococcus deserti]
MQNFVHSYGLKIVSERTHVVRDWKAVEQVFRAPSGDVMVHSVTPRFGGQVTTGRFLKYSFSSPRDNVTAIEMLKAFALDEEVDQLTAAGLESCLERARRLKPPQVKTMLWRKAGNELVKVYCGVSAVTEYVVFDARDLSSSYWRLRSTW